ncbi:hypothetical protein V6N00_12495 [Tersicoccus sp. MR15.9]|uniref:hypothetical protein n=1 Tax=Tersicoccus mangrovi TaxID=3121635 RepID=UPI002FE5E5C1
MSDLHIEKLPARIARSACQVLTLAAPTDQHVTSDLSLSGAVRFDPNDRYPEYSNDAVIAAYKEGWESAFLTAGDAVRALEAVAAELTAMRADGFRAADAADRIDRAIGRSLDAPTPGPAIEPDTIEETPDDLTDDQRAWAAVRSLRDDLTRSHPSPAPYTVESTVIDRLGAILDDPKESLL